MQNAEAAAEVRGENAEVSMETISEVRDNVQSDAAARRLESLNQNANPYDGTPLRFRFQVPPGRTLPTTIGVLKSGACVPPDIVGGEAACNNLVARGEVLRAEVL